MLSTHSCPWVSCGYIVNVLYITVYNILHHKTGPPKLKYSMLLSSDIKQMQQSRRTREVDWWQTIVIVLTVISWNYCDSNKKSIPFKHWALISILVGTPCHNHRSTMLVLSMLFCDGRIHKPLPVNVSSYYELHLLAVAMDWCHTNQWFYLMPTIP